MCDTQHNPIINNEFSKKQQKKKNVGKCNSLCNIDSILLFLTIPSHYSLYSLVRMMYRMTYCLGPSSRTLDFCRYRLFYHENLVFLSVSQTLSTFLFSIKIPSFLWILFYSPFRIRCSSGLPWNYVDACRIISNDVRGQIIGFYFCF